MRELVDVVCIDLDDTIYLQENFDNQIIDLALERLCSEHSILFNNKYRLLNHLKSGRANDRFSRNLFQHIFSNYGLSSELALRFSNLYKQFAVSSFPLLQPSSDAICFIKQARLRSKTFLVSNGPIAQQHKKIELLGLSCLFDNIVILDGLATRKCKPDIGYFMSSIWHSGIAPSPNSLMIGDSCSDELFARRLGFVYHHPVVDLGWRLSDQ